MDRALNIEALPDEILVQIFSHLSIHGPLWFSTDLPLAEHLPYMQLDEDRNSDPLQGARTVPFLGQVCQHWNAVVRSREAQVGRNITPCSMSPTVSCTPPS